jgi:hypothetical protein
VNLWVRLSQLPFAKGSARGQEKLGSAYRNIFSGKGTADDAQMVLADLANHSGFYRVSGPDVDPNARAFADGMRAAYGRIFRYLSLTDQELQDLQEAARAEALRDAVEEEMV